MIQTKRLLLRHWTEADLESFARLNEDPKVMEFFPAPLTRSESDSLVARIQKEIDEMGWGLWAVEELESGAFVGMIGIHQTEGMPFGPAVEIGWRLSAEHWGKGYASEGALAALEFAFEIVGLDEIVALTVPTNIRSQKVMQRIGMTRDFDCDFDHPRVAQNHPLKRHVLYRIKKTN